MNALLTGLATIGLAVENVLAALRATPRNLAQALAVRGHRRLATAATTTVMLLYLLAIGDLLVSATGQLATGPAVQALPDNLFRAKAPYLFEPVLAIRADSHLTLFVSPVNLALGAIVAALAGANAAVAGHAAQRGACRPVRYGGLLGALPAFGIGFACCTPTLLLVLGASTGVALLPAMLSLRPIFYPLTLVLLTAALAFSARPRKPTPQESVHLH